MKKLLIILLGLVFLTGCSFEGSNIDKKVYATMYPTWYIADYIYKYHADVSSIYPKGADISTYTLTEKQKDLYSKGDILIYTSVKSEVELAAELINKNKNLNLIAATKGLSFNKDVAEIFLDPSNYLMVARNINNTLLDYETNLYYREDINKQYEELKIKISELDVEYTMISKNSSRNNILVLSDSLNYLSKYNINVLSLDLDNENYTKNKNEVLKLIASGDIKYAYNLMGNTLSDEQNIFISDNALVVIDIDPVYTISEEQRNNSEDFITIQKNNIEKYKMELFR